MNKLKENIAIEYSTGLLEVLACAGESLPIKVSYSFSFLFHGDGVKIFLWPVNQVIDIIPTINIKFQGEYGITYECELIINIDSSGNSEFLLSPRGISTIKCTHEIDIGNNVDLSEGVEIMEKIYHYLYISNNALRLYTKLLNKEKVIAGLSDFEVKELRILTEMLHRSILDKNVVEAKKTLSLLSEWDFKLTCI